MDDLRKNPRRDDFRAKVTVTRLAAILWAIVAHSGTGMFHNTLCTTVT